MLSKLFHRSTRPNRTPARRGPTFQLEALEARTVMSAATLSMATLNAHPINPTDSMDVPAVVSAVPIGSGVGDHAAVGIALPPISIGRPDTTTSESARPTGGLSDTAGPESPASPFQYLEANDYVAVYVS
jgi:hypothetical protein